MRRRSKFYITKESAMRKFIHWLLFTLGITDPRVDQQCSDTDDRLRKLEGRPL